MGFSIGRSVHLEFSACLFTGESLKKNRRKSKASDIYINHTCALSQIMLLCDTLAAQFSLLHLKAKKLLCTFCSISLPAKADSEQKENTALLFQLRLLKTFLSDSVRLPESVSWICSISYYYCSVSVLNPLSFHSPLKQERLLSPGLQMRRQ